MICVQFGVLSSYSWAHSLYGVTEEINTVVYIWVCAEETLWFVGWLLHGKFPKRGGKLSTVLLSVTRGLVLNSHTSKDKNLKRGKKCKETLFLRRGKVYQGFYVFLEPISHQKSSLCGM